MTPAMIERARTQRRQIGGYTNVEFHLATIDKLPLPDASVDCVICNCVINLAPDKPAVFREIARVLKPGGRLAVSDIALKHDLPARDRQRPMAYVGCIAGAILHRRLPQRLLKPPASRTSKSSTAAPTSTPTPRSKTSPAAALPRWTKATSPSSIARDILLLTRCSEGTLHDDLKTLLATYDVNDAAASVKVYAIKPAARPQILLRPDLLFVMKDAAMFKVIFACVHNAGRSQMAAAFFNQLADRTKAEAISAGTDPGPRVHPECSPPCRRSASTSAARSRKS